MDLPDLAQFNAEQQHALFDLLVLTMYLDGRLSLEEDAFLKRLQTAMGSPDPERALNEAVTRTRPHLDSLAAAKKRMLELAAAFTTRAQHLQVHQCVDQMVHQDGHVASWENDFLTELRLKLRV